MHTHTHIYIYAHTQVEFLGDMVAPFFNFLSKFHIYFYIGCTNLHTD